MPIYEFQCPVCGMIFELHVHRDQKVAGCPHCWHVAKKIMSVANFVIKGDKPPGEKK